MSEENVHIHGLTDAEVLASREAHGVNVLTPSAATPLWKQFLQKFRDPLIIILLVAGFFSVGISCYEYFGLGEGAGVFFEPVGIFIAVLLATGLAFYFEYKADREFAILNQVNDDEQVFVVRNGAPTTVPRRDVVVGDVVILNTGEEIPADGELFEATSLSVDESTLTGEPMAHKSVDPALFDPEATFPSNHALKGTKILEGHGRMVVTAVGDASENGKVFQAAQIDDSVKTPLNEQLDRLGKLITRVAYIIAILVIIGRLIMYFINADFDWISFTTYFLQTVMVAVALVAVAVPEGLPMAVTLSLAYSMRRMLKTNNLVRKMHACETMGATTVICTDKTGTLTQNQMQVARMDFFGNPPARVIAEGIAVNSTAQLDMTGEKPQVLGNPTEGALLLWLKAQNKDYEAIRQSVAKINELPFNTERKYMATEVQDNTGARILYVKGAPEIVFSMCADTSGVTKAEVDALLQKYQNMAMRTLGFAYQEITDAQQAAIEENGVVTSNLKFVGIAAISDSVRTDVPDAVKEVLNAGIQVKIVTGDTPGTAKEIARQIGLWNDNEDGEKNIIVGTEFAALTDSELRSRVGDFKIIARARPLDKKRLVEALQANGEVVAVTGDGTNDAPALKAAHVGLSMGDGTSVAKEASDITIIGNSFASIGRAVMWGRSLYQNIQRFILFQMTVNVAACLIVLAGAFMGMQSPLTVTQMLWVNLIMDTFAAMALASLPPSQSVMREKPRARAAFIINPAMWRFIIGVGCALFLTLLGFLYILQHSNLTDVEKLTDITLSTTNSGLSPYELSVFFTTFVFLQFWNLFNARAFETGRSAFHFKGCQGFVTITLLILVGQVLIVTFGGRFFSVMPLRLSDWLLIIAGSSAVLWVGELWRLVKK